MDLTHFSEEDPLGSELICSNFSLLLEVKFGVGAQSGQVLGTGEKTKRFLYSTTITDTAVPSLSEPCGLLMPEKEHYYVW